MSYIGTKTGGHVFRSNAFNSVRYTGDGTTTQYNLPETVVDDDAVLIHIDGVKQHSPAAYSTSGATLTFTGAPPSASAIEIILFGIGEVNIHTPTTNSVGVSALKTSDGTAGQVLTTDGAGVLSFSSKSTETLSSMGVTSTAAELNILDGVTSTFDELNILDGVTSTAAELNILDGVTSTTAELNILDGVTSTAAELNILDGVTSTAAELNILDGVTASTTELNYVDGVTSLIQGQLDTKQASDADLTTLATNGIGTSANQIVQLDGSAKLPAVDGSNLTGVDSLPTQTSQSGKFLTTNGSAASWGTAGGGLVHLATATASSSSAVSFNGYFSSSYDYYVVIGDTICPSDNGRACFVRVMQSGSAVSSNSYLYHYANPNSAYTAYYGTANNPQYGGLAPQIPLTGPSGNATGENANFTLNIYNPLGSKWKMFDWRGVSNDADYSAMCVHTSGSAIYKATSALSGLYFFVNAGTMTSATFRLYGVTTG